MDRTNTFESAAAQLIAARRTGQSLEQLPEWCRPDDVEKALAIQRYVTKLLDEPVGGWKCGLPVNDKIFAAPIPASVIARGFVCPVRYSGRAVHVEPEIAYTLRSDLPKRAREYSDSEVLDAVVEARLALELVGGRFPSSGNVTFPELLADGLSNDGLFLGPVVPVTLREIPKAFLLEVETPNGPILIREGSHRDDDPSRPLCWLANFLAQRGEGLQAGQVVITGSYAGVLDLPLDTPLSIRFGDLGTLRVQFEGLKGELR
jgi:2-keto-4-pentenoate hydratase